MKRYHVVFADSAKRDIFESYEWGVENWGEELAQGWAQQLYHSVETILQTFPFSQTIAPESDDTPYEIRQMVVGRYRILFSIDEKIVMILHVRGAFTG